MEWRFEDLPILKKCTQPYKAMIGFAKQAANAEKMYVAILYTIDVGYYFVTVFLKTR